ncbi:MAG: sulfurtransferase [Rhodococcus fascians]|uniref:sulfurtransferase n=1 Tax=Rhodococcus sp. 114MFTsu3.1 TaxID=1172184 RepID=UPI0003694282|nr:MULTISPECIES: sulfurtransferase [unclassified Rhodococcus (in: high G+C Gram-positive bacteria)]OZC53720.1 rhodanese-like domain-containing protein [Rhodococcus sp. 06-621-2]
MTSQTSRSSVLVSVEELGRAASADGLVVVLDVRWALGRSDGHELYRQSHIPGAVYVDLDTELAGNAGPEAGRHPLPDIADLQASARRWGLDNGDDVVVYDAGPSTSAARAWWLLRWAGVANVRILDGGFAAWTRSHRPVESGEASVESGNVTLSAGSLTTVDADGAARFAESGRLVDARAAERFRGEVEPVDPKAGHIPGAKNFPTSALLAEDGTFLADDELRSALTDHVGDGTDVAAVYCGSGVTAAHVIAGLNILGMEAALYPGSWSQWSNDSTRSVAIGPASAAELRRE